MPPPPPFWTRKVKINVKLVQFCIVFRVFFLRKKRRLLGQGLRPPWGSLQRSPIPPSQVGEVPPSGTHPVMTCPHPAPKPLHFTSPSYATAYRLPKKCESLQYWIPSLNLLPEDHQDIVGGKWLSDNVINAAQKLLKARHSSIGGLQNTLLAQNMQFQIERRFVQILNVSSSHWIMIANVGCVQGEVHVYDSMGHTDLPPRG